MTPRQQNTLGAIVEIDLEDGTFAYAQILDKGFVFFDFRSQEKMSSARLDEVYDSETLFIISVHKHAVSRGRWIKVGKRPIKLAHEKLPMKFMQDRDSGYVRLYDPNTGSIAPTNLESCRNLERAAVWDAEHVEERLRDTFNGVENRWVALLALQG